MFEQLEVVKQTMELRGLSPHTKEAYFRQIKFFLSYHQKPAAELDGAHVRDYLYHLITVKNASRSTANLAYSALKFFFEYGLQRDLMMKHIPRSKKEKRLPVVLSQDEIQRIFSVISNLKHKAILMTVYSAGLRVSEAANLKITDIDSSNMQIRVNQGKGKVDRYTLLSKTNLEILRQYWRVYRPDCWLFPNYLGHPITTRSIERFFSHAKQKAGIKKLASIHSLRHSFATHLLEDNVNMFYIQKLLGHASIKSTCVYLHLVRAGVLGVTSPLDRMGQYHD
jgi:integrase/recombinase XerD